MKRTLLVTAIVGALAIAPAAGTAAMHGGGGFGGHAGPRGGGFGRGPGFHHGFHGPRTRFFVGGSVFFDPFFYDPFYYPYYVPYPYPAYMYPPPADYAWSAPPPGEAPGEEEQSQGGESSEAEDAARATYGLVQLRGVPDGASVDLDGRFWLTASGLDNRWLALPRGQHTVTVRVRGSRPVDRRIDVAEGRNHVVRFGPFPRAAG
jgi:hypothetical protein